MDTADLTSYNISPLTLIFLVEGDKILTLKRNPDKKIYPGKISGFGGKVEPGEGLIASAHREFTEETGLIAKGFSGDLHQDSGEGIAAWLPIDEFLNNPDIVDHIPLYLKQVIEGKDFYCGIGRYEQDTLVSYTDNRAHFESRK